MSARIAADGTRYAPRRAEPVHKGRTAQARQRARVRAKAGRRDEHESALPLTDSHRQLIDQARYDLAELGLAEREARRAGRRAERDRLLARREEVRALLARLLARAEDLAEAIAADSGEDVPAETVRLMTARPRGR